MAAGQDPFASIAQPVQGSDPFASIAQPVSSHAPEKSFLGKIWDHVNTPIADYILPKGINTADLLKGAAFEKLGLGPYIPGVNDFDTRAKEHFGESPTKDAIKAFVSGAANDTANMAAGFTSPLSLALAAGGAATKLPGAVGTLAKVASTGAGTAMAGKGVYDISSAGTENTPEAWKQRLEGGAELAGGSALAAPGVSSALDTLPDVGKNIAQRSITKLIRPMAADVKFGRDPAGAVIREGITGNSLEDLAPKVFGKAREVGQQIDAALQTPEAQAKTIDVSKSLSPLDDRMAQAVKNGDKGLYDRLSELKQQLTKEWAEDPKTGSISPVGNRNLMMTPHEATILKRQVGDMTRWTGNDPFENELNAAKGEVFGKIKDQVNQAVPDVKELNSRYSDLVSAGKAIERRLPVAARNAEFSLGDIVLGTGGYGVAGPAGLAAVAAKKLLSTTAFKTRMAQAVSPEANIYPPFEKAGENAAAEIPKASEPSSASLPSEPANGRTDAGAKVPQQSEPVVSTAPGARTEVSVPGTDHVVPAQYEVRELSDVHPFEEVRPWMSQPEEETLPEHK